MSQNVNFSIDGKPAAAPEGSNLVEAIRANGGDVPTLCWEPGKSCLGTCRVCLVRVNGREVAACNSTVSAGATVDVDAADLKDTRQGVVELLFVEGNHFCPGCEKSGDCELQGVAYHMGMTHARFPYRFAHYELDYRGQRLMLERNRCIHCKRCTDHFVDDDNHKVFSFIGKGKETRVMMDLEREANLSVAKRLEAIRICPVGAIILKGKGFDRPIGTRRNDHHDEPGAAE